MTTFGDHALAARLKDVVDNLAREAIERERPLYRYGTVQSIDHDNRICVVRFPGETVDVTVRMGGLQPTEPGQIVRVDGYRGDRFVVDVIGGPVFTASVSGSSMDAPVNFLLESALGALLASWSAVDGAHHYELQLAEDAGFSVNVRNISATDNFFRFDNLDPDITYHGRVRASTQYGSPGPWSDTDTGTPLRFVGQGDGVAPVSSPAVTCEPGLGMIVAAWAPSSNTDPVTYAVYAHTVTGFTPSPTYKIGETSGTFYVVDRLADGTMLDTMYGTNVYVRIIEIDPDGQGPASAQGVAAPRQIETGDVANIAGNKILDGLAPSESPDSPTLRPGIGFIYASWDHVTNQDMVTYEVHISTISGFTPSAATLVQETPSNYTFIRRVGTADGGGALQNGVTYYIRLVAKDADGSALPGVQSTTVLLKAQTGDIENLAITNALIADLAVDSAKIATASITTAKIANASIVSALIQDLSVTEAKINDLAVATAKIQSLAVTTGKINDLAVTTAKIDSLAVTEAKIGNLAVTNAKINSVDATKITTGYLSASRIEAGTITGSHLSIDTITANNIQAGTITASEIAANTITGGNIAANTVTGGDIGWNTITGSNISGSTITGSNISGSTISNSHIIDVSASKLTTGTLSASTSITIASGGYIASSNYSPGSAGFIIYGNGSAEFNNVTIRGTGYFSTLEGGTWSGGNGISISGSGYFYIRTSYADVGLAAGATGKLYISGGSYAGYFGATTYGAGVNSNGGAVEMYCSSTQVYSHDGTNSWMRIPSSLASTGNVYCNAANGGYVYLTASSGRYKEDVIPLDKAISRGRIRGIQPRSYKSNLPHDIEEYGPDFRIKGFVVEELAALDPTLVTWEYPVEEIEIEDGDQIVRTQRLDTSRPKEPYLPRTDALLAEVITFMQDLDTRVAALEAG